MDQAALMGKLVICESDLAEIQNRILMIEYKRRQLHRIAGLKVREQKLRGEAEALKILLGFRDDEPEVSALSSLCSVVLN